jgi:hypothetical protein
MRISMSRNSDPFNTGCQILVLILAVKELGWLVPAGTIIGYQIIWNMINIIESWLVKRTTTDAQRKGAR